MIIALPNDGRGLLYHIIDLNGQTVHAYRDFDAALRAREGDQRIAILQEPVPQHGCVNRWLTDPPARDLETRRQAVAAKLRTLAEQDDAKADELAATYRNVDDLVEVLRHSAATHRATADHLESL